MKRSMWQGKSRDDQRPLAKSHTSETSRKQLLHLWLNPQMTKAPDHSFATALWVTRSQNHSVMPLSDSRFSDSRFSEAVWDNECSRLLTLGIICYAATDDQDKKQDKECLHLTNYQLLPYDHMEKLTTFKRNLWSPRPPGLHEAFSTMVPIKGWDFRREIKRWEVDNCLKNYYNILVYFTQLKTLAEGIYRETQEC